MKKFYRFHIHSCFASYSSNDVILYKEFETKSLEEKETWGDNQVQVYELPEDKRFYNLSLKNKVRNYHETKEFLELVSSYTNEGWSKETPQEVLDYFDREEVKRIADREKNGFVITSQKDMSPEDYQGGFSDSLFSDPFIRSYVSRNLVFGYLGSEVRTVPLDSELEKEVMAQPPKSTKYSNKEIFAVWLTSTDARHFSDSLEDPKRAKSLIETQASSILDTGLRYLAQESEACKRNQ